MSRKFFNRTRSQFFLARNQFLFNQDCLPFDLGLSFLYTGTQFLFNWYQNWNKLMQDMFCSKTRKFFSKTETQFVLIRPQLLLNQDPFCFNWCKNQSTSLQNFFQQKSLQVFDSLTSTKLVHRRKTRTWFLLNQCKTRPSQTVRVEGEKPSLVDILTRTIL